jgi:putative thiamine transport system ATP-binding protein
MSAGALELHEVWLALGRRQLLSPLSLRIAPGTIATVMGPSGCGKSSLLAYLCGVLEPSFRAGGRVVLDGRDIATAAPERRRLGLLLQDEMLFPHLSVGENLAFALPARHRGRERRRLVEAALGEAGLAGHGERDALTLSGGQRARVALMRTLLAEPLALLLDEPFAGLDQPLKYRFRQAIFQKIRAMGLPALLVTHNPDDATAAAGPVVRWAGPPTAPLAEVGS